MIPQQFTSGRSNSLIQKWNFSQGSDDGIIDASLKFNCNVLLAINDSSVLVRERLTTATADHFFLVAGKSNGKDALQKFNVYS